MQVTTTTTNRTARTPEGRLRQRVHSLARELSLCEDARRNILLCVAGSRYARELNLSQLEVAVAWLEREAANKRRSVYAADDFSDEAALAVLA